MNEQEQNTMLEKIEELKDKVKLGKIDGITVVYTHGDKINNLVLSSVLDAIVMLKALKFEILEEFPEVKAMLDDDQQN